MFMKKISLFTLALATGVVVFAQSTQGTHQMTTPMAKKVMFGVDAGVNLATFDAKDFTTAPNTNMKTSFHGGVFVDIPLGGNLHLEPSIVYSAQGSKYSVRNTAPSTGTTSFEEDLHYIYVAPAKLKLMIPTGGLFVETGPQLGYLVKADVENSTTNQVTDIKDNRKKLDFLWSAGVGYMTPVGLAIHGRYNYGLSNVLNAEDDANQSPGKLQNRVIQIGLAYHFGATK